MENRKHAAPVQTKSENVSNKLPDKPVTVGIVGLFLTSECN